MTPAAGGPARVPGPPALGTILPSYNRVVERTTAAILARLPGVDGGSARIPHAPDGSGQPEGAYATGAYAAAARLLGHAGVAALCWNGTRGAALGLAADGPAHAAGFAAEGIATLAARGLGCVDNHAARAPAAEARPVAILAWSTNLPGLEVMAPLEAELGVPVLDGAALGVAALLDLAGIPAAPLAPPGSLFAVA